MTAPSTGQHQAFAVLAAVQSAVACALRRDATSSLSEQDFFFCKSLALREKRGCGNSWGMRSGIEAFMAMVDAKKLPVTETCLPYDPGNPSCSYECSNVEPSLQQGVFEFQALTTDWEMQKHIRLFGSVVTRLNIFDDFKKFFESNPNGVYTGHGPKATYKESHAVVLVGYDLDKKYWLVKNSWGVNFAASGFCKVAFGVDGVGYPEDTFGISFMPDKPPPKPRNRLSNSSRPGCYKYRTLPSDYVSKVATTWGMPIQQLLLDNLDSIPETDRLLGDMTLTLCGITLDDTPAAPGRHKSGFGGGGSSGSDKCDKCNVPVSAGGCKCDKNCDCRSAPGSGSSNECDKCNVPVSADGCKCDSNCNCRSAPSSGGGSRNECDKCNVPVSAGGCKCDSNCDCL
ncbi:hypothetical protein MNEG_4343 [Monoraphidium neglectum]|uniref:Peptidase C1A papain C-terminal domain-containing protein n=1 Tax=Monoraphidium neglectum TaxID=145388 RepID=A0A0D2NEH5_9CHLO|nr:hypothetical protein MNEG_4343 [Monoraphidium neglectum]KIZ03611.1 hypothetical protein MNEG_4343 [Monoraphidium neglectum]|eukprot:XP_013902630.1 hypothetical protein MNEG_4343 [Monoraphidium neglectum]